MPGGGVVLQTFAQIFTSSGSWTAPDNLAGRPFVAAWGPGGESGASVAATHSGGGGGSGSLGGESQLAGVAPGTVLTVTIGTSSASPTNTTVTGGSVTVTGNAGGNGSGNTAGSAGTAPGNTISQAGAAGGAGSTVVGRSGGSGAGAPGLTAALAAAAGTAGTASSGAGSVAGGAGGGVAPYQGATGGAGGAAAAAGNAGIQPGSGAGGAGDTNTNPAVAGGSGQAVIIWQTVQFIPMAPPARRRRPRAVVPLVALTGTIAAPAPVAVPAPVEQPRTLPRRPPTRGASHGTAVPGIFGTPGRQPPGTAVPARRKPARAVLPLMLLPPNFPPPPVSPFPGGGSGGPGGDRTSGLWDQLRTGRWQPTPGFGAIDPGAVPLAGASVPPLPGRGYAGPSILRATDTALDWSPPEPVEPPEPPGEPMGEKIREQLRDAGDGLYEIGRALARDADPAAARTCGQVIQIGGAVLICQERGKHRTHAAGRITWK